MKGISCWLVEVKFILYWLVGLVMVGVLLISICKCEFIVILKVGSVLRSVMYILMLNSSLISTLHILGIQNLDLGRFIEIYCFLIFDHLWITKKFCIRLRGCTLLFLFIVQYRFQLFSFEWDIRCPYDPNNPNYSTQTIHVLSDFLVLIFKNKRQMFTITSTQKI